ncbi:hypothetical protein N752_12285 [Desulforamulus aquiferis]|nr:hypothetical protein N752_12285 [Desulforamulus aquiferis]
MSVNLRHEELQLEQEKRRVALRRARELKARIDGYLKEKQNIPNGFEIQEEYCQAKAAILNYFQAGEEQWKDWHWQMTNRIRDVKVLGSLLKLTSEELEDIDKVGSTIAGSITLLSSTCHSRWSKRSCMVQAIPSIEETKDRYGAEDLWEKSLPHLPQLSPEDIPTDSLLM